MTRAPNDPTPNCSNDDCNKKVVPSLSPASKKQTPEKTPSSPQEKARMSASSPGKLSNITTPKSNMKPTRRLSSRFAKSIALAALKNTPRGHCVDNTTNNSVAIQDRVHGVDSTKEASSSKREESHKFNHQDSSLTSPRDHEHTPSCTTPRVQKSIPSEIAKEIIAGVDTAIEATTVRKRRTSVAVTPSEQGNKATPRKRNPKRPNNADLQTPTPQLKTPPASSESRGRLVPWTLSHLSLDHGPIRSLRVIIEEPGMMDLSQKRDPFPIKLFLMVQWTTLEHPDVCQWSEDGRSIQIYPKHPALLEILGRFFKQSKWYSFSRQLNNYGFLLAEQNRESPVRSYHHKNFYRDISDPSEFATLLPYLPGKNKANTPTKSTRKTRSSKSHSKSPKVNVSTPLPSSVAMGKKKKSTPSDSSPSIVDDAWDIVHMNFEDSLGLDTNESPSLLNHENNNGNNKAGKHLPVQGVNGKKKLKIQGMYKAKDSFKTPSPHYRKGHKKNILSSPPLLSHYLQKKEDPHLQHLKHHYPSKQSAIPNDGIGNHHILRPSTKQQRQPEKRPYEDLLLTENVLTTPSPVSNNELTPRTSNLSTNSSSPTMSLFSSSPQPKSSPDGVRMLSWAAKAVESPEYCRERPSMRTDDSMFAGSHGKMFGTAISYVTAIGCSPITLNTEESPPMGLLETIECSPIKTFRTRKSSLDDKPTYTKDSFPTIGSTPLNFQNHQETDADLDILKFCLEDIFG